jgi:hypothetical protein
MTEIPKNEKIRRFDLAIRLIDKQAEDEALWSQADCVSEAYCQQEFRKLVRVLGEGVPQQSAWEG